MSATALTIAVAALAALTIALAIALVLLYREQRRMRFDDPTARAVAEALRAGDDEAALAELLGYLERLTERVNAQAAHLRELDEALTTFRRQSRAHLQRIGLVRFDASESVSGQLSRALCVLDAEDNGFLITTLYDLEHSRTFVRPVTAGRTDKALLDEEREALTLAQHAGTSAQAAEERADA